MSVFLGILINFNSTSLNLNAILCSVCYFISNSDSGILLSAKLVVRFQTRRRLCPGVPGVSFFFKLIRF